VNPETKTRRFLSRILRDYYSSKKIDMPYRFTKREFAFIYMGAQGMHRPVAFNKKTKARKFLKEKSPLHSYYSTAYYSNPEAPMAEKEWLGADLIFDLDADHLPGGNLLTYPEQLNEVKKKTKLLIHDFLIGDFGFNKEDLDIYFSGHRGYHIHIRNNKVLNLSSESRREIVDYITGIGLDIDTILPYDTIKLGSFKEHIQTAKVPSLPDEDSGGWMKRTRKLTIELLKRWSRMDKEDVKEEMEEKHGIGKKTAEGLYNNFFEEGKWKKIIEDGVLDVFSEDQRMVNVSSFEKIIKGILQEENVQEIGSEIIGSTDEPVTGDTKRLIRLPQSIHGGSFLKVTSVDIDRIDEFYPLSEGIIDFLGEKEYVIKFDKIPRLDEIKIGEKTFDIQEKITVPEYAASFLVSKFKAKLL
ncbi:MAG: DNA primase catalytic subunit PriS, partial [Thermoplasmatota archaeon]